ISGLAWSVWSILSTSCASKSMSLINFLTGDRPGRYTHFRPNGLKAENVSFLMPVTFRPDLLKKEGKVL
ncbi:MAG TPA: hypothetical protein VEU97_01775, partial [Ktedonobacteraceae bacterium]|nr:hypothetical protein [Ktedonobacteraceae bacterium]